MKNEAAGRVVDFNGGLVVGTLVPSGTTFTDLVAIQPAEGEAVLVSLTDLAALAEAGGPVDAGTLVRVQSGKVYRCIQPREIKRKDESAWTPESLRGRLYVPGLSFRQQRNGLGYGPIRTLKAYTVVTA